MMDNPKSLEAVRSLLEAFNAGYARRDLSALDDFMHLFASDERLEYIAVGGVSPGRGAWRRGTDAVRKLLESDWDYWGRIAVDLEQAHISALGEVAWLSAPASVTTDDETEEFLGDKVETLGRVQNTSPSNPRRKPLRMTAVLVRRAGTWQFLQIHLSYSVRSLPK